MPPRPIFCSILYSPIIVPGARSLPCAGAATALPTVTTGGSVGAFLISSMIGKPCTAVSSNPSPIEGVSVDPSFGQTRVPTGHCFPQPPHTGMLDHHITKLKLSDRLIKLLRDADHREAGRGAAAHFGKGIRLDRQKYRKSRAFSRLRAHFDGAAVIFDDAL